MAKKILLVIIMFLLLSCSHNDNITYIIKEEHIEFIGNIMPYRSLVIQTEKDKKYKFNVDNNDYVNEGTLIYSTTPHKNNLELQNLETQKTMTQSDASLKDIELELKKLKTPSNFYAPFSGFVIYDHDSILINTKELKIRLTLNENEFKLFIKFNEFNIYDDEHQLLGTSNFVGKYQWTEEGYLIDLDINLNNTYLGQTVILRPKQSLIKIPKEFIIYENKEYFVFINKKQHKVNGTLKGQYFYVEEGLTEGDIIEWPLSN